MNTKRLLAALVLVVAVALFLIFRSNRDDRVDWQKDFAVPQTAQIEKLLLADKDGGQARLERVDGVWMINGRYPARRGSMQTLLNTIAKLRIIAPVSDAAYENVVRNMMGSSIQVKIFNDKDKLMKVFHVGGPAADGNGTHMVMERKGKMADRPYLVTLAGFKGFLTSRFFTDEDKWRSLEIIAFPASEIQRVKVDYPLQPEKSFEILRAGPDSLTLRPDGDKADPRLLAVYLQLLKSKSVETYMSDFSGKDSVLRQTPFCRIEVEAVDGRNAAVDVLYRAVSKRTQLRFGPDGQPAEYDAERYYFSVGDGFGVLQYYVFGPLFRARHELLFTPPSDLADISAIR